MTAPLSSRQAHAASPATAPRPGSAPVRRGAPPLRVVGPVPRRRRSRGRLVTLLVSMGVLIGLFGLVASHVMLTQGQFRLDTLRARTATEQARYERLRLKVATMREGDSVSYTHLTLPTTERV